MTRLIDLETATEVIRFDADRIPDDLNGNLAVAYRNGMFAAINSISSCPAVDAVEVVRCKDCWYHRNSDGFCEAPHDIRAGEYADLYTEDEDFCSKGVRKY